MNRHIGSNHLSQKVDGRRYLLAAKLGLIGAVSGSVGPMLGVGGGLVAIPLLGLFAGKTQHVSQAMGLCSVLLTGCIGTAIFFKSSHRNFTEISTDDSGTPKKSGLSWLSDRVDILSASVIAGVGMISSPFAARYSLKMSPSALRKITCFLMIGVAAPLVGSKRLSSPDTAPPPDNLSSSKAALHSTQPFRSGKSYGTIEKISIAAALGLLVGVATGGFGLGGGIFMVPILSLIVPYEQAVSTSLMAMIPPALSGVFTHYRLGNIPVNHTSLLLIGTSIGSLLGTRFLFSMDESQQRMFFISSMVVLSAFHLFLSHKGC